MHRNWGRSPSGQSQLYQWMHQKLAPSLEDMTNLAQGLSGAVWLGSMERIQSLETVQMLDIRDRRDAGNTCSSLGDGNIIESVLMKYHHGNSVCISSQVGCRMGCRFCASTLDGLKQEPDGVERCWTRSTGSRALTGERVSNVVVMGTRRALGQL